MMWILAAFFQFLVIALAVNKDAKDPNGSGLAFLYVIKVILSIFAFYCVSQAL